MPNDTNPDVVDKADALVGIADAVAAFPEGDDSVLTPFERLAQAIRLYACSLYGHRPEWGETGGSIIYDEPNTRFFSPRNCQRCGRDLQPAERAQE